MATPGNIGDILTTTLRNRTGELADNVSRNNAILRELKKRSLGFMPFDGGRVIDQEINYANNTNATWYAGYETVAINPQETFSMAEYDMKLLAVAVSISGEEMLKNSGKERSINLVASRVMNAEQTMDNVVAGSMYSDGTGSGGKEIGGLQLLVADTPTNTVGGISRTTWPFWANISAAIGASALLIQPSMDGMWVQLVRGNDRPRIILAGNTAYNYYLQSLQAIQRVTDTDWASAGFTNLAFMGNTPVILDGGYQGSTAPPPGPTTGGAGASRMYFLNTNYLHFRPHKDRNMDVMDPDRYSTNQDAVIKLIGWAGNMTISNGFLQGVLH
ncbi:hypothetical protein UFOVP833_62 [uncultured Caudovirales phage]|uniref:Uncharacterized protein n=1 Tax=uncultured Caudovirales phage TaxID=2100421 RepID=A0A6J5P284_9CAUD|nr:hypothetical protein UFOVP833_62 [uncultured Caudovirales phage]CAB4218328.1 hypothetical protein UFOVP1603_26 [uncultured Caudovirales phage]